MASKLKVIGLRQGSVGEQELERQLRFSGLTNYAREHRFHSTRKWRFDFAFIRELVAVEVEGGIWVGGAHTRGGHFESDAEKYNEALILGWRVLRVSTKMVRDGRAVEWIRRAITTPAPSASYPIFICATEMMKGDL